MKKKVTFSALEDEIRVIWLPHLNIQDYKKPVQWVAKINEVNKEAGEILRLPERTPFGMGDIHGYMYQSRPSRCSTLVWERTTASHRNSPR